MRHEEVEPVVRMWRRSRDESRPWLEARMSYTQADDLGFFRDVLMRVQHNMGRLENSPYM